MKYRISWLLVTLSIVLIGCSASVPGGIASSTPLKSDEQPSPSVSPSSSNSGQMLPIAAEAQIGGQRILLEVTRTPQEQQMGLMYRTSLAPNRGMLFSFNPPRPVGFWMRNVKIPLDMVFLRDGEVQAIAASVPPCTTVTCPTYGPEGLVDQVIELRGGRAAELGLNAGDRLNVKFLNDETSPPNPSQY
ncbi:MULTISPECIES: DUF192 domain-containing protein [unclassified Coleofasciculus]|uniref:DUF192 domain-containing protein n=1 Tax=unclassified Coleofasciculus TaxID=2692782 RepID=UPI001881109D|nr:MULTISPECIES: DUF192 domain-containing protein [unclassified Coleofasciculus]MBE9127463.1 DUF192 domain-containing protein [Coleofasciculus sp. LEGE 07081]MBE9150735.1 DUF192 domain-containing protein [Coleofasciculus sp. LEGE 07092]